MASKPQLPELDYESMGAEEILRAMLDAFPGPRLARLLLPEGGVGPARHALRDRPGRPRVRARHARALPRDLRGLEGGRAPVRHEGRDLRGADARPPGGDPRRRALGAQARPLLRDPQGRAARPRARRARRLDHRAAPRPVADPRERAEGRLGRAARALEGEPARRLGRRALLRLHPRARASLQHAARPRLLLDRLHPLHEARRRTRGPLDGLDKTECGLHVVGAQEAAKEPA